MEFGRFWALAAALALASQVLVVDGQSAFTVRTAYEDSTCSGVPSHLAFWPATSCEGLVAEANASCQAIENALFAVSSCTTDYEGFASAAFGDENPFVIDRQYVYSAELGLVYVYSADAYCHVNPDDSTSFRARIDTAGRLDYSFFRDLECTTTFWGFAATKDMLNPMSCSWTSCDIKTSLCSRVNCYNGCRSCMSVGGLSGSPPMGKQTAVVTYQESSCGSPAVSVKLTSEQSCTPQIDHYDPVCVSDGSTSFVTDCTQYNVGGSDDLGIIDDAFGDSQYLVVENYAWCGMVDSVAEAMIYRLDEKCHPNAAGSQSYKLTLGSSVTITTYADANCAVEASEMTVTRSMISSGECVKDQKFLLGNAQTTFTAVAVYEDSTCSGTPSQLTFEPVLACDTSLNFTNVSCEATASSLFAKTSCTDDYSDFAFMAFGSDNFYAVEEAVYMYTSKVEFVTVYLADGACHTDVDGSASFIASIGNDRKLTLGTYSDQKCNNGYNIYTFTEDQLVASTWMYVGYCWSLQKLCRDDNNCYPDWWYCQKRISIGGPSGAPPMGKYTLVALYEDSGCTAAVSVKLTHEMGCTPQSDHFNPVCTRDGEMYSVSDCTQYYAGGWDDAGLISHVFGDDPYLIVEKYLWCGTVDTISEVEVYRLDGKCYRNTDGTGSHKAMLGRSLTITKYSDGNCTDLHEITSVDRRMVNESVAGRCPNANKKYFIANIPTVYDSRIIYEDSTCSGTPSLITFSAVFGCEVPVDYATAPCQAIGNGLFAVSNCTTDYAGFAAAAFGDSNAFMIDRLHSTWDCTGDAGYIYVYSADGSCHVNPDEDTSFRARIDTNGGLAYTYYQGTDCPYDWMLMRGDANKEMLTSGHCLATGCYNMGLLCSYQSCDEGCSRMMTTGGPSGKPSLNKHTAVATYQDFPCSPPAVTIKLSSKFACSPSSDPYDPVCASDGDAYSVTDCTQYDVGGWDDAGIISDAFGASPYLVVEKYVWCDRDETATDVMVYRLDEKCYPNAARNESHKLTLGRSVTIETFSDPYCGYAVTRTEVPRSSLLSSLCVDGEQKFRIINAPPAFTSVVIYEDSACSGNPSQIIFTPTVSCDPLGPAITSCQYIGNSLFSVSSCTNDYIGFANKVFDEDTRYVIEQAFTDDYCNTNVGVITTYLADNTCHSRQDGYSSFRLSVDSSGSLFFEIFYDPNCKTEHEAARKKFTKVQLMSATCMYEYSSVMISLCSLGGHFGSTAGRKLSIGGIDSSTFVFKSAVLVYDESSCAEAPVQLVVTKQASCSSPEGPSCAETPVGGTTVYQDHQCIEDVGAFAKSRYNATAFLIVEKYKAGTNCGKQKTTVVYKADGLCYYSFADGTSFRILPGFGGSVVFVTYPTTSCDAMDAEFTAIGSRYVNTGVCYAGGMKIYGDVAAMPTWSSMTPSPSTPTPSMDDIDQKTREEIMFPEWLWEPAPRRVFESN